MDIDITLEPNDPTILYWYDRYGHREYLDCSSLDDAAGTIYYMEESGNGAFVSVEVIQPDGSTVIYDFTQMKEFIKSWRTADDERRLVTRAAHLHDRWVVSLATEGAGEADWADVEVDRWSKYEDAADAFLALQARFGDRVSIYELNS